MRTILIISDERAIGVLQAENGELVGAFFAPEVVEDWLVQEMRDVSYKILEAPTRQDHLIMAAELARQNQLMPSDPAAFDTMGLYEIIEDS